MLPVFVLMPVLIALGMLHSQSAVNVARKLYIPVILFMPMYLQYRVGGLVLSPSTLVTVCLAVAAIVRWHHTIKLGPVDYCVAAYAFSAFYADFYRHPGNLAYYALEANLTTLTFPYIIGRLLVEQSKARTQFAQTLVACLAIVSVISLYEYRMGMNPFVAIVTRVANSSPSLMPMMRFGFTRICGPYGLAIPAGMIFTTGLMIQLWLAASSSWFSTKMLGFIRGKKKPLYITMAVGGGLVMCGSRGPWLGAIFGLIVASIGFARNRKRAATIAISVLLIGGSVTYVMLDDYTNVDPLKGKDTDQQNAAYRRDMLTTYAPLIDEGGMWGLGTPMVKASSGQSMLLGYSKKESSIDNEYLRATLQQGYFGVTMLGLILVLTMVHLLRLCVTMRNRNDILMAYCFLGALVAAAFTLTTVFLGDPMSEILFLVCGWAQSIKPTETFEEQTTVTRTQQFQFERVFG